MTRSTSNGRGGLRLTPRHPPGRSSRKARAYAAEIGRLHALGYTLDAIRTALADVGVIVSLSTVRREAIRCETPSQTATVSSERSDFPIG